MKVVDVWGVSPPTVYEHKESVVCVNPDLVIGYELETENCTQSASAYTKIGDKTNFGVTVDNSLRGSAYEFISRPMKSKHALSALGEFLKQTGFNVANYTDRCSVHVHVNCTDLELEQVSAISLLYTVFEEILFEFVGHDRDSNIYCVPWNQCRMHFDLIQNFLADSNSVLRRWNKYTALNLLPLHTQGTIEFRQMHGTADMEKLTTWTNIIGAICKTAVETPLNDLIAQIKDLNNTSQYEAFFMQTLAGQLPYNEVYRMKMEEGVIFAKFTLMNMTEKKVIKPKKASPAPRAEAAIDRALDRIGQERPPLVGAWTTSTDALRFIVPPPDTLDRMRADEELRRHIEEVSTRGLYGSARTRGLRDGGQIDLGVDPTAAATPQTAPTDTGEF